MMNGDRLRELRNAIQMTQAELGRRARVHPAVISNIEHNRAVPWPGLKKRISRVLRTPVHEVFPEQSETKA